MTVCYEIILTDEEFVEGESLADVKIKYKPTENVGGDAATEQELTLTIGTERYHALPEGDDAFVAAGGNTLICAADPAHPFTVSHSGGTLALCGSIGFSARGLGGRFDYNNSIRGASLLTLTPHRAGYTAAKTAYVYASDLGLTER